MWPWWKNTILGIPPRCLSCPGNEKEKKWPKHCFCFLIEDNDTTRLYKISSPHWCFSVWQKQMRPLWLKPPPDLRGFAGKVLCCSLWQNKFFIMIPRATCVSPRQYSSTLESQNKENCSLIWDSHLQGHTAVQSFWFQNFKKGQWQQKKQVRLPKTCNQPETHRGDFVSAFPFLSAFLSLASCCHFLRLATFPLTLRNVLARWKSFFVILLSVWPCGFLFFLWINLDLAAADWKRPTRPQHLCRSVPPCWGRNFHFL